MKRVILANTASNMKDADVLHLIGRRNYDQLYQHCIFIVDDEIYNNYGDIEDVDYTNSGCTGRQNTDGTYTIMSSVHAEFTTESGRTKYCYAELKSLFDGSSIIKTEITHFSDDVEYE